MDVSESFLQETLAAQRHDLFSSLRVMMPGQIISYDSASGLASVQPMLRRKALSGELLSAPCLMDVPVLLPSPSYEISEGDPCLLLFADFCLDGWLENQQPVIPPSTRQHDLSDAIALVGYFPCLDTA